MINYFENELEMLRGMVQDEADEVELELSESGIDGIIFEGLTSII